MRRDITPFCKPFLKGHILQSPPLDGTATSLPFQGRGQRDSYPQTHGLGPPVLCLLISLKSHSCLPPHPGPNATSPDLEETHPPPMSLDPGSLWLTGLALGTHWVGSAGPQAEKGVGEQSWVTLTMGAGHRRGAHPARWGVSRAHPERGWLGTSISERAPRSAPELQEAFRCQPASVNARSQRDIGRSKDQTRTCEPGRKLESASPGALKTRV